MCPPKPSFGKSLPELRIGGFRFLRAPRPLISDSRCLLQFVAVLQRSGHISASGTVSTSIRHDLGSRLQSTPAAIPSNPQPVYDRGITPNLSSGERLELRLRIVESCRYRVPDARTFIRLASVMIHCNLPLCQNGSELRQNGSQFGVAFCIIGA